MVSQSSALDLSPRARRVCYVSRGGTETLPIYHSPFTTRFETSRRAAGLCKLTVLCALFLGTFHSNAGFGGCLPRWFSTNCCFRTVVPDFVTNSTGPPCTCSCGRHGAQKLRKMTAARGILVSQPSASDTSPRAHRVCYVSRGSTETPPTYYPPCTTSFTSSRRAAGPWKRDRCFAAKLHQNQSEFIRIH